MPTNSNSMRPFALAGTGSLPPKAVRQWSNRRTKRSFVQAPPNLKTVPTRLLAVASVALPLRAVDEIELDVIAERSPPELTQVGCLHHKINKLICLQFSAPAWIILNNLFCMTLAIILAQILQS